MSRRRRQAANPPCDFDKAVEGYRTFQDLEPTEVGTFEGLHIPSRMPLIGKGVHVLYRSDKWGEGTHDYIHEHDAGVKVLFVADEDDEEDVAAMEPVPDDLQNAKTLYLLGKSLGFAYKDKDGNTQELRPGRPYPELYATPSGKTLVIIANDDGEAYVAAVIFGGGLDVRSEGIVG